MNSMSEWISFLLCFAHVDVSTLLYNGFIVGKVKSWYCGNYNMCKYSKVFPVKKKKSKKNEGEPQLLDKKKNLAVHHSMITRIVDFVLLDTAEYIWLKMLQKCFQWEVTWSITTLFKTKLHQYYFLIIIIGPLFCFCCLSLSIFAVNSGLIHVTQWISPNTVILQELRIIF